VRWLEIGEGGGFGGVVVEEGEEFGGFEGAAEVGAEMAEAEVSAFGVDFAMGFDEGAEAGAVDVVDVFEIDDDAGGVGGEQRVDGGAKAGGFVAEGEAAAEGEKIDAVGFALRDFERHRGPFCAAVGGRRVHDSRMGKVASDETPDGRCC